MGTQETMELIYSLAGFPNETEWIEFKESNSEPTRIARDISALANSAAYLGKEFRVPGPYYQHNMRTCFKSRFSVRYCRDAIGILRQQQKELAVQLPEFAEFLAPEMPIMSS